MSLWPVSVACRWLPWNVWCLYCRNCLLLNSFLAAIWPFHQCPSTWYVLTEVRFCVSPTPPPISLVPLNPFKYDRHFIERFKAFGGLMVIHGMSVPFNTWAQWVWIQAISWHRCVWYTWSKVLSAYEVASWLIHFNSLKEICDRKLLGFV